jgi:hypothetical protein
MNPSTPPAGGSGFNSGTPLSGRPGGSPAPGPDSNESSNKATPIALVRKGRTDGGVSETSGSALPAGEVSADAPSLRLKESGSRPTVRPTVLSRPLSASERLERWITRPMIAVPATIACVTLLGWSLLVRLPASPLIARARTTGPSSPSSPAPNQEEVTSLAQRAAQAVSQAVSNIDQLPRLIASMEQQARAAGFVTDLSTRPPTTPLPGVPGLSRHSVVFRLENNYDREEPAFTRLLLWMRSTAALGVRVEPGAVSLQSLGDGMTTATVEWSLFSMRPEELVTP